MADLDIWTRDHIQSSAMIDSTDSVHLLILRQDIGWGYFSGIAVVMSENHCLPDSFCVNDGVLVSVLDYTNTLEVRGFRQVLCRSAEMEMDTAASSLPDTLVLACISCLFRAEPDTSRSIWVLIDGFYQQPDEK